jgi:hypothetical protein
MIKIGVPIRKTFVKMAVANTERSYIHDRCRVLATHKKMSWGIVAGNVKHPILTGVGGGVGNYYYTVKLYYSDT